MLNGAVHLWSRALRRIRQFVVLLRWVIGHWDGIMRRSRRTGSLLRGRRVKLAGRSGCGMCLRWRHCRWRPGRRLGRRSNRGKIDRLSPWSLHTTIAIAWIDRCLLKLLHHGANFMFLGRRNRKLTGSQQAFRGCEEELRIVQRPEIDVQCV